jgi:glutathionylspermidine synthase
MHFSSVRNLEEFATVEYLRDTAFQASPRLESEFTHIEDIGVHRDRRETFLVDQEGHRVRAWFKLYPWEHLFVEKFGRYLPEIESHTGIIEPAWKAVLSNKAILPTLWEMYEDHPLLLRAAWTPEAVGDRFIHKPIHGREGGNMQVVDRGRVVQETSGEYGDQPSIYQELFDLPRFDGQHAVVGSWVVGDEPAGIVIREDEKPIIVNRSRVCPHYFV